MRSGRGPGGRPAVDREAPRHRRLRAAATVLVLLVLPALAPACGSPRLEQASSRAVPDTTPVTALFFVTTTVPPTTTQPPESERPSWREVALGLELNGPPSLVGLSDDFLVVSTSEPGGLYAYSLATAAVIGLPAEGWVGSFDVEGSLVVWTESPDRPGRASTWAYRLPDGPRVPVLTEVIDAAMLRLEGGRLFYTTEEVVKRGLAGAESLYRCPLRMLRLDSYGNRRGDAVLVTEEPKASRGGDQVWSFDVAGPVVVYQEDWGLEGGVHLLDLDTGARVSLGAGTVPSVTEDRVAWEDRTHLAEGTRVSEYDPEVGTTVTRSFHGYGPLVASDYLAYLEPGEGGQAVTLLDYVTGARTVLAWWRPPDAWRFVSMAGTASHFAWVERGAEESRLHLLTR